MTQLAGRVVVGFFLVPGLAMGEQVDDPCRYFECEELETECRIVDGNPACMPTRPTLAPSTAVNLGRNARAAIGLSAVGLSSMGLMGVFLAVLLGTGEFAAYAGSIATGVTTWIALSVSGPLAVENHTHMTKMLGAKRTDWLTRTGRGIVVVGCTIGTPFFVSSAFTRSLPLLPLAICQYIVVAITTIKIARHTLRTLDKEATWEGSAGPRILPYVSAIPGGGTISITGVF